MPQFRVEIFGYIDIDAESKLEALRLVKEQFEMENLTYEDLSFDVTYDSTEEE